MFQVIALEPKLLDVELYEEKVKGAVPELRQLHDLMDRLQLSVQLHERVEALGVSDASIYATAFVRESKQEYEELAKKFADLKGAIENKLQGPGAKLVNVADYQELGDISGASKATVLQDIVEKLYFHIFSEIQGMLNHIGAIYATEEATAKLTESVRQFVPEPPTSPKSPKSPKSDKPLITDQPVVAIYEVAPLNLPESYYQPVKSLKQLSDIHDIATTHLKRFAWPSEPPLTAESLADVCDRKGGFKLHNSQRLGYHFYHPKVKHGCLCMWGTGVGKTTLMALLTSTHTRAGRAVLVASKPELNASLFNHLFKDKLDFNLQQYYNRGERQLPKDGFNQRKLYRDMGAKVIFHDQRFVRHRNVAPALKIGIRPRGKSHHEKTMAGRRNVSHVLEGVTMIIDELHEFLVEANWDEDVKYSRFVDYLWILSVIHEAYDKFKDDDDKRPIVLAFTATPVVDSMVDFCLLIDALQPDAAKRFDLQKPSKTAPYSQWIKKKSELTTLFKSKYLDASGNISDEFYLMMINNCRGLITFADLRFEKLRFAQMNTQDDPIVTIKTEPINETAIMDCFAQHIPKNAMKKAVTEYQDAEYLKYKRDKGKTARAVKSKITTVNENNQKAVTKAYDELRTCVKGRLNFAAAKQELGDKRGAAYSKQNLRIFHKKIADSVMKASKKLEPLLFDMQRFHEASYSGNRQAAFEKWQDRFNEQLQARGNKILALVQDVVDRIDNAEQEQVGKIIVYSDLKGKTGGMFGARLIYSALLAHKKGGLRGIQYSTGQRDSSGRAKLRMALPAVDPKAKIHSMLRHKNAPKPLFPPAKGRGVAVLTSHFFNRPMKGYVDEDDRADKSQAPRHFSDKTLALVNAKDNDFGDYCRVLVIDKDRQAGIDVTNVTHGYSDSSFLAYADCAQAIYRGVRHLKHCGVRVFFNLNQSNRPKGWRFTQKFYKSAWNGESPVEWLAAVAASGDLVEQLMVRHSGVDLTIVKAMQDIMNFIPLIAFDFGLTRNIHAHDVTLLKKFGLAVTRKDEIDGGKDLCKSITDIQVRQDVKSSLTHTSPSERVAKAVEKLKTPHPSEDNNLGPVAMDLSD